MKKFLIIFISFIAVLFVIDMLRVNFIDNMILINKFDSSIKYIAYIDDKRFEINNTSQVSELYTKFRYKWLTRVSNNESTNSWNSRILSIEPINGGSPIVLDSNGRLYISKEKGDIRNKSWLHWLWWKYDNLNNPSTSIIYLSSPDKALLDFANRIRLSLK